MAKSSKKKSKKKDEEEQRKKAAAKAKAKAAAKAAALADDAKKARKAADKAVKAADKAQAKAVAAGAPAVKQKPDEAELLRLALRSTEAKLTDAERRVEALERQIADFHTLDDQVLEETIEDAIVDAAVEATVADAVLDSLDADPASEAAAVEAVAIELDEIVAETEAEVTDDEPSHEGEAAAAAEVFQGAEAPVTAQDLTPPLPEEPADDQPNESWTLLRLRAEAKRRGLTGTSNLPKAALLDRLRSA
jgi:hypothetical protein